MRLDLRTAAEQLCRSVRLIARRAAAAEANQPTVHILRPYQPIPLVGQMSGFCSGTEVFGRAARQRVPGKSGRASLESLG